VDEPARNIIITARLLAFDEGTGSTIMDGRRRGEGRQEERRKRNKGQKEKEDEEGQSSSSKIAFFYDSRARAGSVSRDAVTD